MVTVVTCAGLIGGLFGVLAFFFLVWRDHGHPKVMLNEQSAPAVSAAPALTSTSASLSSKTVAPPAKAQENRATSTVSPARHEFSISKASAEQQIGSVRLKLTKTDSSKGIYDMRVITGRRWFTHRHLKINEPFWIANKTGAGAIEMVVTSIAADSVSGYWTESQKSAHINPRVRPKRR